MKINFYSDSDLGEYDNNVSIYQKIWEKEGEKIIGKWEDITGLTFRENYINAIVFDGVSHSHPLSLRFNLEEDIKKAVIIHELGHRILYKRLNIKVESLEIHKALFLVLYDLYVDLYGEKFAKEIVEWDCSLPRNYKEAWNWALSFDRTERIIEFKKLLK